MPDGGAFNLTDNTIYIFSMDESEHNVIPIANFSNAIITQFTKILGTSFDWSNYHSEQSYTAIDVLDYIYAVLYSPSYRKKYKNQLKINFPRIPYPRSLENFDKLKAYGSQLRNLHLMKDKLNTTEISFTKGNSLEIVKPLFIDGNILINKTGTFFSNVSEDIWNMGVGGYQPLKRWLDERKGCTLSNDDILYYKTIIITLKATQNIMEAIDQYIQF